MGTGNQTRAFRVYSTRQCPGPSDLYDQVYEALVLAGAQPDVRPNRRRLHVRNGFRVCTLTWDGRAWKGTCTYGEKFDPRWYPCCEAMAVDIWTRYGLLPDPRLMIMDDTLLTNGEMTFEPRTHARMAYDLAVDVWRDLVQGYARRRPEWRADELERWYLICTAWLACPDQGLITDEWDEALDKALDAMAYTLPEWLYTLAEVNEILVDQLGRRGWESKLAEKDALCDWVDEAALWSHEPRVRAGVRAVSALIRGDLWSPYYYVAQIAETSPAAQRLLDRG